MNGKAFSAALFFAISGCSTAPESGVYSPACTPSSLPKINNVELVLRYEECGDKEKAKLTAKAGAEEGIPQMAVLYLILLEPDGDTAPGLVYALKYAEEGDEDAIVRALGIVKKYRIKSLTGVISEMYLGLFEKKVPYMKWILDDYIAYSADNIKYNGDITIAYSKRFLSMARGSLSDQEYEAAALKINSNSLFIRSL